MVERFVAEGAKVSYCARSAKPGDFTELQAEFPDASVVGTPVDISSRESLYDWVNASADKFGRIDSIIANGTPSLLDARAMRAWASTLTLGTASNMEFESKPETWDSSFKLDIMGFVNLVEAALPHLEKSPNPSIIVQSSFMGREVFRTPAAPYGACKAAQLQHVQELSHTLGPKGIRVNAISPGPIMAPEGAWEKYSKIAPEWVDEQRLKVPLKRFGTPAEIANVAVFLASHLASYISGANVMVDGGIHVGTQF
jgi:NAD(P)-dependent dehydrogenase (short-subunit alcohol dehydrogenase family)